MTRPASVANSISASLGAVGLTAGMVYQALWPSDASVSAALFVVACFLVPVALCEVLLHRVHERQTTGLTWASPRPHNLRRVTVKLVGFLAIVALVCLVHAVFRIYAYERLIYPVTASLLLAPFLIPLIAYYFLEIDRRMETPEDGYFEFGAWVLRLKSSPDRRLLDDFLVNWAIKGFFLPIMFTYLALTMPKLADKLPYIFASPVETVLYIITAAVVFELTIVVVGYSMTVRLFDAHIRSPNKLLGAWVVTMICYEPFNRVMSGQIYPYHAARSWADVIEGYPLLMWPWLVLILSAFLVWVWSTAIFGLRWSNLTHRGVITNGPYRYTKHPDYIAKSVFFWLTSAPFLTAFTIWEAVTLCLGLVMVNAVYFGRALMEEKHLSVDPDYVDYALAMNRESIFAPLARHLPFLIYRAPDGRKGIAENSMSRTVATPAE